MDFQRLMGTAQEFWNVFEHFSDDESNLNIFTKESEKTRFLCLIGFTSLDAQVNAYWQSRVLPEWSEMLSLVNLTLDDSESLDRIVELASGDLNHAQMMASLRFIAQTENAERFAPSFTDAGLIWLLLSDLEAHRENYVRVAKMLFQLQKIRNTCFHTSRDFNELRGREALILFHKLRDLAPSFHPTFLGEGRPMDPPQLKAA